MMSKSRLNTPKTPKPISPETYSEVESQLDEIVKGNLPPARGYYKPAHPEPEPKKRFQWIKDWFDL